MPDRSETVLEALNDLLEAHSHEALKSLLADFHPTDLVIAFHHLPDEDVARVFSCLNKDQAGNVLAEADEELKVFLTEQLADQQLSDLLEEMDPDDAADVVGEMEDKSRARRVLDLMEDEERSDVENLLTYDEDTAGGIMTSDFLAFPEEWTVREAVESLRKLPPEITFTYAFSVDQQGHLTGVFPAQNLIWTDEEVPIHEITDRDVNSLHVDADQEEVAKMFSKFDLVALPVVDQQNKLIGRVTVDDILDVVQDEGSEDMFLMAGTRGDEFATRSFRTVLGLRLPWMLVALAGGIGCAFLLGTFETELEQFTYLAFYLPVLMSMGGNVGNQSSTLIVRGLATGQLDSTRVFRTIGKEVRIGMALGIICGTLAGLFGMIYSIFTGGPLATGLIVGSSMFIAMAIAALFASMVPLLFSRVGIDPAVASGPFITMSNDALGIAIYLSVARLMSHLLVGSV